MKSLSLLLLLSITFTGFGQSDCSTTVYSGTGTFYIDAGTSPGACAFPITENLPFICAINLDQYNTASLCGTCLEVTGNQGSEIVYVVDQFSPSSAGDLDFNQAAFEAIIGNTSLGSGAISWKVVSCPLTSFPLELTIGSGVNPFYHVFLIHRHVNQLSLVEEWINSSWVAMTRTSSNSWERSVDNVSNTNVRVTDIFGEQIVINGIDIFNASTSYFASTNFTPCLSENSLSELDPSVMKILVGPTEVSVSSKKLIQTLRVLDMNGRMLIERVYDVPAHQVSTPMNGLSSGSYILQLEGSDGAPIGTGQVFVSGN